MTMTVGELIEVLSGLDESMEVRIAYQPNYPLYAGANHVKVNGGKAYICQSSYGDSNGYAPRVLFADNENNTEESDDSYDDEEEYYE